MAAVERKRDELGDDDAVVEYFVDETAMGELWNEAMARPVAAVDVRGVLRYLDRSG